MITKLRIQMFFCFFLDKLSHVFMVIYFVAITFNRSMIRNFKTAHQRLECFIVGQDFGCGCC